jgi:hypothetical protein
MSSTEWKDSLNRWFQGFSLFHVHCHCWGPRHLMCSASVGRSSLSSRPRSMKGRLAVGLMDPACESSESNFVGIP